MDSRFNIYCDESCHLLHDDSKAMVLGAVWCPVDKTRKLADGIREIKKRHGLIHDFEIKWNKVSPSKQEFYADLIEYFFGQEDLHFRAVVIPDKTVLDHRAHSQSHDTWYYKMMFVMLEPVLRPGAKYRIYLDYKDTRSAAKIYKLAEHLRTRRRNVKQPTIERLQSVHSHEVEQMQLADLFIGAIGYLHRRLNTSSAKKALIELIENRSGTSLMETTFVTAQKVNILVWSARESSYGF
ncbi:MAG: DUF3800 domain-containing protein [Planctomycetota bacterium]